MLARTLSVIVPSMVPGSAFGTATLVVMSSSSGRAPASASATTISASPGP
jgi:hypothetical protein